MAGQDSGGDAANSPDVAFTLDAAAEADGATESARTTEPPAVASTEGSDAESGTGSRDETESSAQAGESASSRGADATTAENAREQDFGDADTRDHVERIVDALIASAPASWERLYGEFAVTVTEDHAQVVFTSGGVDTVVAVPEPAVALAREYRAVSAEDDRGPWWRLLLHVTPDRVIEIDYDYGDDPFPEGQLFGPAAYRADLETYPRERLPLWLAAYIRHADRQTRSPQRAAAMARADRAESVWSELAENELPPLPILWARWATLAAAFVAAGSEWGPRILPSLGWFESARRSGATLALLPGDRAVLSGGVWNAPALDATYNGAGDMPKLYAGAPEWVADPVLNPRAASGLLSFCYWWEGGRWYRGESPNAEQCAPAIPGVWTADTVRDIANRVVTGQRTPGTGSAMATLVATAENGTVTEEAAIDAFGGATADIDGALFQFRLAGLVSDIPTVMPEELALARVRQYITGRGLDTTGYPLDELVADRLDCGWMVYVPVPKGELAIGRAIFYIADDGVLEPSSSSVPPARFVAEFEKRYQARHRVGLLDGGLSAAAAGPST
ncbi:hypothetical protein [Nocardia flavorosea]|uniref:hypothetical protein n=1 Tax=Nocardia flavorosea TaxID=53429 RepID=UPI000AF91A81|nr:hypothetical protein [Nocardia flavorosea]